MVAGKDFRIFKILSKTTVIRIHQLNWTVLTQFPLNTQVSLPLYEMDLLLSSFTPAVIYILQFIILIPGITFSLPHT